jgi:hypothetical protein
MAFRGLAEAAPGRYLVLDATGPASELAPEILATVDGLLSNVTRAGRTTRIAHRRWVSGRFRDEEPV